MLKPYPARAFKPAQSGLKLQVLTDLPASPRSVIVQQTKTECHDMALV